MNEVNHLKIQFIIAAVAALFFVPFLGGVHLFDWDEINFAEAAREMIVTGDYMTVKINFLPFWEKPPVFIWMQVASMKLFGINEFAARLPNAIAGIVTLLTLFNIGRKLRDNLFGVIWVLAYGGSLLPFLYFKSGIIDPWFNLFIFLSVYFLMLYSFPDNRKPLLNVTLSAAFAGLAILTKGPVGFLLVALTGGIYLLIIRFKIKVKFYEVVTYFFVLAIVGGFWFLVQIANGNYNTVVEFIVYQIRLFQTKDAGHGGFLGYHFVVLLFGVFPTSVLALKSFRREKLDDPLYRLMKMWMIILFWVVLILFTIVKTKIVHYSSLTYFPLSFLAANYIANSVSKKYKWSNWQTVLTIFIAVVLAFPVIALQFVIKYKDAIIAKNWIHDSFAVANLAADVHWGGYEFIPGVLFLLSVILLFVFTTKKEVLKRAVVLLSVTTLFTFSVLVLIVPRIEGYSQRALIEFFQSKAKKDVYVKNINFKSYATAFYGEMKPPENKNFYNDQWLLTGDIDKDVYFVTKIDCIQLLDKCSNLKKTGEKNGFVFFVRKAK